MLPELINRLDYIIVFRPLSKRILTAILKKQLEDFLLAWRDTKELRLPHFSDKKLRSIVDKVYDPLLGARPLLKYIDNEVEPSLIDQIMK